MSTKTVMTGFMCAALCALLWPNAVMTTERSQVAMTGIQAFQSVFHRITMDGRDAFVEYEHLEAIYSTLEGTEKGRASQMLSMVDAMFGRYQDAENHYYAAFPAGLIPGACPVVGVTPQPALVALRRDAVDAKVVMINESHSIAATRALLIQMLPMLRQLGFKYLALEALFPASNELVGDPPMKMLQDSALPLRGYPLDQSAVGFYLREPIYAELVREAIAQGFKLVAYEVRQANSRDEREDGQAKALAKLIAADPAAKVAVIAGYGHIWKADGLMADRLQREIGRKVLSIDQTSRMLGCAEGEFPASLGSFVLVDADEKAWASSPSVDVTVVHSPGKDGRTTPSGWLTLGGRRKGVQPDTAACADAWPCLVSAVYAAEDDQAVPADRVLLDGVNDKSLLFLKPGTYRYVVNPHGRSTVTHKLTVH